MIRSDILVEIFEGFDNDEKTLSKDESNQLTDILNKLVQHLRTVSWNPRFYKPRQAVFPKHVKRENCSLYLFRATPSIYIVLTFDDDPLFNQKILGLFRIANSSNKLELYNDIAQKLYQ